MNLFEETIYKALLKKYSEPEWIVLDQVRTNTGVMQVYGGERIIDFFIMNMYPSKKHVCISIEVKQDIVDLLHDIKDSTKQVAARFYADHFYYLVPQDLFELNKKVINKYIHRGPDGLMIYTPESDTIRVYYKKAVQEKSPFSFGFVASLIRRAKKC